MLVTETESYIKIQTWYKDIFSKDRWFSAKSIKSKSLKSHSSALLISRYILRLGQRGLCCFCGACPNRKMYLEIRSADDFKILSKKFLAAGRWDAQYKILSSTQPHVRLRNVDKQPTIKTM